MKTLRERQQRYWLMVLPPSLVVIMVCFLGTGHRPFWMAALVCVFMLAFEPRNS